MFKTTRCSFEVSQYFGSSQCHKKPFEEVDGCLAFNLIYMSQPNRYGASHFLKLLDTPASKLPNPEPPTQSPSPPITPPPQNPPNPPPLFLKQSQINELLYAAEEEACVSVYSLNIQTRCERLAAKLGQKIKFTENPLPSPPPAQPILMNPPPSQPPSPPPLTIGVTNAPNFTFQTLHN